MDKDTGPGRRAWRARHEGMGLWLLPLLLALLGAALPAQALDTLPTKLLEPRFDDLDGMAKRRSVRALVAWSKTDYFIVKGQQRGIAWEAARDFEKFINSSLKRGKRPIAVVMIPVSRDKLISYLEEGRGDIAFAGFRQLPSRAERIDFSAPVYEHADEVVVRNKDADPVHAPEDLAGKKVWLRPSSSYYQTLLDINGALKAKGLKPADIQPLDEHLADEDILEMINAGLIDYTILDDFRARLWSGIFTDVVSETAAPLIKDRAIAFGLRRNTPRFKALVNRFVKGHKIGTEYGNVLAKRYFVSNVWARSALSPQELQRFRKMVGIFQRYGETYKFDHLMLTAQGYQESGLDQRKRSHAGAIGVMQVMPSTGRAMKVGDISKLDPNIHAGVKYMSHLGDVYFNDPGLSPLNRALFCFAAYNAGPTRISALRRVAKARGLDPDVWFDNVERVAAERIGRETIQYVVNISKYYVAYKLVEQQDQQRAEVKASLLPALTAPEPDVPADADAKKQFTPAP